MDIPVNPKIGLAFFVAIALLTVVGLQHFAVFDDIATVETDFPGSPILGEDLQGEITVTPDRHMTVERITYDFSHQTNAETHTQEEIENVPIINQQTFEHTLDGQEIREDMSSGYWDVTATATVLPEPMEMNFDDSTQIERWETISGLASLERRTTQTGENYLWTETTTRFDRNHRIEYEDGIDFQDNTDYRIELDIEIGDGIIFKLGGQEISTSITSERQDVSLEINALSEPQMYDAELIVDNEVKDQNNIELENSESVRFGFYDGADDSEEMRLYQFQMFEDGDIIATDEEEYTDEFIVNAQPGADVDIINPSNAVDNFATGFNAEVQSTADKEDDNFDEAQFTLTDVDNPNLNLVLEPEVTENENQVTLEHDYLTTDVEPFTDSNWVEFKAEITWNDAETVTETKYIDVNDGLVENQIGEQDEDTNDTNDTNGDTDEDTNGDTGETNGDDTDETNGGNGVTEIITGDFTESSPSNIGMVVGAILLIGLGIVMAIYVN